MPDTTTLVERHQTFVESFDSGDLAIPPALSTVILTCVDARVDPAHVFGLDLGDALVLRNPGAKVTSSVLQDLAVLGALAAGWPGDRELELVIVAHTGCGMAKLAEPAVQQRLADRLGFTADGIATLAVTDPAASVRDGVDRLRRTRAVPDDMLVAGFVYDVGDGTLDEVVAPGPLRPPT